MNSDQISGLVRHLITVVGGIFITKGYADSAQIEIIAGAVAALFAIVWSHRSKRVKQESPKV
jgi:flagellar motor component MotA